MNKQKPPVLSDDWDNNLYRNVVHVLAETEGMIPGGQAERVIQVIKALLKEEIKKSLLADEEIWRVYGVDYTDGDIRAIAEDQLDKVLKIVEGDVKG